jgi:hypothetical protein
MAKIAIVLIFVAGLLGCSAVFQKPSSYAESEWPVAAAKDAAHAAIKEYFEQTLKDPESARYRFIGSARGYSNEALLGGGHVNWRGRIYYLQVNARNSYGGYTGGKPYMALLSGNQVVRVLDGHEHVLVNRVDILEDR